MEEIGKQNMKSLRSLKSIIKKGIKGSYKTRVKKQQKLIRTLESKKEGLEEKKLKACGKTKAAKAEQKNLSAIEEAKEELKRLEGEKSVELVEDDEKASAKKMKKDAKAAKKAAAAKEKKIKALKKQIKKAKDEDKAALEEELKTLKGSVQDYYGPVGVQLKI